MPALMVSKGAATRLSDPAPSLPRDLISTGKAASILGVSIQCVVNMVNRGELQAYTLSSGHRRLSRKVVLEAAGLSTGEEITEEKVVIYARVSTSKQSSLKHKSDSDLTRQLDRLRQHAKEHYPNREIVEISDVGSGLNYTKPGLTRLLNGLLSGEFRGAVVLVENRDRLTRWGCEIYETVAAHASVEIKYVDQQDISDSEMLQSDLLSIMTIFTTRTYSRRSAERRRKKLSPEFVNRATELINQGLTLGGVAKQLELEGFRDEKGEVVGFNVINNQIAQPLNKLQRILPGNETPTQRYIRENTEERPLNFRLKISDFHADYVQWCKKENVTPVSSFRLTSNLPNKVRRCGYLKGVIVKGKKLHTTVKVVKEHARTQRLNEKLKEFCDREGIAFSSAMQKLQVV